MSILSYIEKFKTASVFQFAKFAVVGVINTLIMLSFYWILLAMSVNKFVAISIGYIISILIAFLLNSKWVFTKKKYENKTLVKFFMIYINSLIVTNILLYLFTSVLTIDPEVAPLIIVMITTLMNYFFNKHWVFIGGK